MQETVQVHDRDMHSTRLQLKLVTSLAHPINENAAVLEVTSLVVVNPVAVLDETHLLVNVRAANSEHPLRASPDAERLRYNMI